MSGNICISNWSSSGFGNCCKLLVHITEVVFNFLWNFYGINAIKIYCYKNLLL